ncbi:IS3 family transposase [Colwellia sp. MB02u-10]|nr:IS3 family transposase [Colwellia sp. MB02u-10]
MKQFFRRLKTECLNAITFINSRAVMSEGENYIQFYNYKPRHSAIDYTTPHQKLNELKSGLSTLQI